MSVSPVCRSCPSSTAYFSPLKYNTSTHASKRSVAFSVTKHSSSSKPMSLHVRHFRLSSRCRNVTSGLFLPKYENYSRFRWTVRPESWIWQASSTAICVYFCSSEPAFAEANKENNDKTDKSASTTSSGKRVYKDYSITGIPGDGRCLFRSVAHGACIRSGKPIPNENLQRQLADELRKLVVDEFIRRREETEWFIEGDFDRYMSRMREPHVWGGEPELLMASHVLQMPITVYMHDRNSGGLIAIAEYGQEYGKENPIRVLYHGSGHYDAVQIPGRKAALSKL